MKADRFDPQQSLQALQRMEEAEGVRTPRNGHHDAGLRFEHAMATRHGRDLLENPGHRRRLSQGGGHAGTRRP